MAVYFRFDDEGYYIGPVIADYNDDNPMPNDVTEVRPPDGLYRARFNWETQVWEETGQLPEPEPQLPTEMEQIRADIDYLAIMTGVEL